MTPRLHKSFTALMICLVMNHPRTTLAASSEESLEACKSHVYERMMRRDKLFSAISLKLSKSMPLECVERKIESETRSIIENENYFANIQLDNLYREETEGQLSNLIAPQKISGFTNQTIKTRTQIRSVLKEEALPAPDGYKTISGSKKNPR
jgi:hypothetical protein